MQETIPQIEKEFETLVGKFIDAEISKHAQIMGETPRHRLFEGHQSNIIRPNGEEDNTEFHEVFAETEIFAEDILYSSLEKILNCFIPIVQKMAKDQEKTFFNLMSEITAKTGNVIDAAGTPLSHETILESLRIMPIAFDTNGNPRMPTIVASPAAVSKLKESNKGPLAIKFNAEYDKIIEQKRLEWREREAHRTLVG